MTAEELTADRRAAGPVVRLAIACRVAPVAMAASSVGFAAIAAGWLTVGTTRADGVALGAAVAVYVGGHTGRVLAEPGSGAAAGTAAADPAVAWGLTACGVIAEAILYAGIAAAGSLHPAAAAQAGPAGNALGGAFLARLGGTGATGVWRLAIIALILALLLPVLGAARHDGAGTGGRPRLFGVSADIRLPLAAAAVLLAGARPAFVVLLVLGVAALGVTLLDGTAPGRGRGEEIRAYRGDGRLSIWIGGFVKGRLPPLPPLCVGLLVTGMLVALGLRNLPGVLVLTPVEAMLLAALASWHPHDGRRDWLAPPLLQAAEYVFLAEAGLAGRVWPPLVFALVLAAGFRHLDLMYRVRGGLASGVDRRGLGWEGRMIVAGIAAAAGIQLVIYPALVAYLGWLSARDWIGGWSGGHPADPGPDGHVW